MSSKVKKPVDTSSIKTVNEINASIAEMKNVMLGIVGQLNNELITRREEYDKLGEACEEKKTELAELNAKEKLLLSVQALAEELEDRKRAHERALKQMDQERADKEAAYARAAKAKAEEIARTYQDADRMRKLALEDEDRKRKLDFEAQQRALDDQKAGIGKLQLELGSFDERVKAESAKQANAIKREVEFKATQAETQANASIRILNAEVERYKQEVAALTKRLAESEAKSALAVEKANALALAAVDAESGKKALEELRTLTQKQAEAPRR